MKDKMSKPDSRLDDGNHFGEENTLSWKSHF